ncbi:Putative quinoprotein alcohol dehydrogenase-like superfamily [Septoria linicola]|uniref:Quinoprotein alcohol dehydrogenase-like superfamily n=1 Tax=Septoria linicola TaxID=215465 RepID=A0A9Q9AIU9_9PEZI|nr:Putative quinoprotein alcohol dehydrogenase-like superfamily [Septoria linicola]
MSALYGSLRLTPSNSPFFRSPSPRSPTKTAKEEPCLHLHKSIGTTTTAVTGFDALSSRRKFAYTAGAAVVVVTVEDDLSVTQDFFRAKPTAHGAARDGVGGWPSTPTPNDARYRGTQLKDNASPLGTASRDWSDSPTGRSTTAKDRIKSATSVALSPNGKWLAIGETGYRPRILIFSLKDGSSEAPICVLSEHTFGVHALSFSSDSRFLASLGTVNDGFLYVWSIEERTGTATLHASNKCTSFINDMTWMGNSIIIAGLRIIKIWRVDPDVPTEVRDSTRNASITPRPEFVKRASDFGNSILSPKHRVLAGKNCLLGDLWEATFVSVTPVSSTKALICTDAGEICLLDDSEKMQSLSLAVHTGYGISAARKDARDMFHVYGPDSQMTSFLIPDLERRASGKVARSPSVSPSQATFTYTATVAAATLDSVVITIDSCRSIRVSINEGGIVGERSRNLSAHQDAVLGVLPIDSTGLPMATFCTYSGNGTVRFWTADGETVSDAVRMPLEESSDAYGIVNEMRTLAVLSDGTMLASGDKYGTIAVVDLETRRLKCHIRAHTAEVTALLAFDRGSVQFLVSASRDRTIQLFLCNGGILELIQTMDEHAGAVTGLLLSEDGDHLMSCSADRSIVVREAGLRRSNDEQTLAFAMLRAITLKSAPTSMCLTGQPDAILVSSTDRCVAKYSTKTGTSGFSFKCNDNESGEAVVLSKVLYAASLNGNPTIAGVSSTDKSVRLYTEYGSLVARDWGHTEGITDAALIPAPKDDRLQNSSPRIVTVAADSTIFIWQGTASAARSGTQLSDHSNGESTPPSTVLGPPLRKVLSHSEMSKIRRERAAEEQEPPSPSNTTQPPSPPKVKKKSSRMSLAQAPRLEPGFRSTYDSSRRRSLRHRSPSPPSPRNTNKKENIRGPAQLGMTLRFKSSENVLKSSGAVANSSGFGTLTSSTDSVCRTLRMYRKKLVTAPSNDSATHEALRELEKELRLTVKVLSERTQGKSLDEQAMSKLLDQASTKIGGMLDERIKSRDGHSSRKSSDAPASPMSSQTSLPPVEEVRGFVRSDTAPGALETGNINTRRQVKP